MKQKALKTWSPFLLLLQKNLFDFETDPYWPFFAKAQSWINYLLILVSQKTYLLFELIFGTSKLHQRPLESSKNWVLKKLFRL